MKGAVGIAGVVLASTLLAALVLTSSFSTRSGPVELVVSFGFA
jgi:hypothetical protein